MTAWTFLTNHGHVLLYIAAEQEATAREIAEAVGITERSCQRIVAELEAGGYVSRERVGRRNHYTLHLGERLRHPLNQGHQIGELIALLAPGHSSP